jgi:BioD-like phosphotransacetylase family protein
MVKLMRQLLNKNLFKIETLDHIKEKIKMNEQQYEEFKNSVYSKVKNKGDKKIDISFKEMLEKHPDVIPYINQLKLLDSSIIELETDLKNIIVLFKNSVERIKELMRENNTEIESRIFKLLIKETSNVKENFYTKKVNNDMLKDIIEKIKNIKTQKIRKGNNNRKTLKRSFYL